jgi:hypothetical protein
LDVELRMPSAIGEILYVHATRQTRTVGPGHWFFHTGQWAVCGAAGRSKDGRWSVVIYFVPHGKERRDEGLSFASIDEVQRFVGDYFGCKVRKVSPRDMPGPDEL